MQYTVNSMSFYIQYYVHVELESSNNMNVGICLKLRQFWTMFKQILKFYMKFTKSIKTRIIHFQFQQQKITICGFIFETNLV